MVVFLVYLIAQFSTQYYNFVTSSKSDSVFVNLTRGTYNISDFANDPVVLWFWRSNTGSAEADSFLKRNHLRKNFHLAAVLRWEAKETEDVETKLSKLHLAAQLDSSSIENFLSFISLGVAHRDFKIIKTAFSLPVLGDFRNQLFLITNFAILLLAAIFMTSLIYILVKTVHYLPVLGHRIIPVKHGQITDIMKSLVLLIPVLVLRNFYLIFICYAILLILVFNNREKNWFRFNIIMLILIFIVSLPISNFIIFLKEHNNNYKLYEIVNYDIQIDIDADKFENKELLAYAYKQQRRLDEALNLYEDLYYGGNRNIAIVNNLANLYFLYDESELAESLYHFAIISEDRGESYFNMGLLKLKNIEYSESSKYMEEARKRNFSSLSKEPIDIKPTNNNFYRVILSEQLRLNGFIKNIYMVPFLIILILTFLPLKLSRPFFCTSCGRPICKNCISELGEETICNDCFTRFKSTKKAEIEADLRRAAERTKKRVTSFVVYVLNIIIPGAGLIYIRKHCIGLIIVFLVMMGYVPLLFPQIFIKPSGWIALPTNSIFIIVALLIAIISYFISFSFIREYHAD